MNKAALIQGLGNTIEGVLPNGESFVLLTFPADGKGEYHDITNAKREVAIKHLRNAADVLERREEMHVPPGIARAAQ